MRLCDLLLLILTYPSIHLSVTLSLARIIPRFLLPMGANDFFSARARVLGFLDESDDAMPSLYLRAFVSQICCRMGLGTKRSGRGKEGAGKLIFFAE